MSSLLEAFVEEVGKTRSLRIDAAEFESGERILALAPEEQVALLVQLVDRQVAAINAGGSGEAIQLKGLVGALLRRKLPFSAAQLEHIVGSLANVRRHGWWETTGAESILRAVEGTADAGGLRPSLCQALERLAAVLAGIHSTARSPR